MAVYVGMECLAVSEHSSVCGVLLGVDCQAAHGN